MKAGIICIACLFTAICHAVTPESEPAANLGHRGAAPVEAQRDGIAARQSPNYRAIVERYGTAVVGVTTQDDLSPGRPQGRLPLDSGVVPPSGDLPQNPNSPQMGLGSGFIIRSDGVILTNAHVVQGADSVTVTLNDRREYKAKVIGLDTDTDTDTDTDVAVIKVDGQDMPVVKLGDSDRVHVGDYVLAIGTPFGFDETATSGIISALRRPLPDNPYVQFIQTDAAVNPGNSGGPLFDERGAVIGINAQIYSSTGSFQGLSFAVPIDLAKHVADLIIASGSVRHGWLGVTVQQLTQPLANAFGLTAPWCRECGRTAQRHSPACGPAM